MPPPTASSKLSVRTWRTILTLVAPIAARIASSVRRAAPFAIRRFATLTHAISRTQATVASRISKRLTNVTGDVLTEFLKHETDVVIASRILLRELRGECVHFFLRRGTRRAIFQPDERGERMRAARRRLSRSFGHERGDDVRLGDREVERGREHSDDGVGLPVERESAAEHARIAAETRAPERCAQNDDALGSGVIVRRLDQAAQKRSGAEQRQHVAGDEDAVQPLRL